MTISEQLDDKTLAPAEARPPNAELAHANLALIGALLDAEAATGANPKLFDALRAAFAFDQALVLEGRGDELECTASVPEGWTGRRWPKAALEVVLSGGVLVNNGNPKDLNGSPTATADLIAPNQPMLGFPIGIHGSPAAILLLRAQGKDGFGDNMVAVARQCAVVALAALAARQGVRREAEVERLQTSLDQLKRSEQTARRGKRLMEELLDHLPIGVTVQDTNGRFILVNATAAANLATPADVLTGASPGDFLSDEEAKQRRQWEIELIQSGRSMSAE